MKSSLLTAGALVALVLAPAIAGAQPMDGGPGMAPPMGPNGAPIYRSWQNGWDNGQYDRRHVILGRVAEFHPYRLTIARNNGVTQTIDLKNGTRIFPTGDTPQINQRVAVVGYYSNGTFIANRVILRD